MNRRLHQALALLALLATGPALAAVLTVNSLSDLDPAGDGNPGDGICEDERAGSRCTLRAAIQEANALDGLDTIAFSVAGSIVVLGTALPAISDAIILDGTSAPGYTSDGSLAGSPPVLTLDGGLLAGTPWGLTIRNADAAISDVLALSVVNFAGGGIRAMTSAHDLLVQGCYVGVRPDGSAAGNGTGISLVTNDNLVGQFGLPGFGTGLGNVISSNAGVGLLVLGSGTLVRGNRIGTGPGGGNRGNGDDGVQMLGSGHVIGEASADGANVITHNSGDGVRIFGDDNVIVGNDIGGVGLSTFGNGEHGIAVHGADNRIGGEEAAARNRVRGNGFANVLLGSDANPSDRTLVINNLLRGSDHHGILVHAGSRNRIVGNDIGDNAGDGINVRSGATTTGIAGNRVGFVLGGTGTVFASPNLGNGIHVAGGATYVGFDVVGDTLVPGGNSVGFSGNDGIVLAGNSSRASLNHVGLTESGDDIGNTGNGIVLLGGTDTANLLVTGNVVGNNGQTGISVHSEGAKLCTNRIGTNDSGTAAGNALEGIWLTGNGNTIGDGGSCGANLIGFNAGFGINVSGNDNLVHENWIGVASNGADMGNGSYGILLAGAATGNLVIANALGYNQGDGVRLGSAGNGNRIELNAFIGHDGESIDLGPDGPTPNDAQDVDTGPNRLQNHPVIEFATAASGVLQVTWRVNSAALHSSYPLAVDFYLDRGDGAIEFVGRFSYATPFAIEVGELALPPGGESGQLYAMATDDQGNSSELSAPKPYGLPEALFANGFESP